MRPVSVLANGPESEIEKLEAGLRGQWRQAARAVMVLLSLHGLAAAQIAGCWTAIRPRCAAGSAGSGPYPQGALPRPCGSDRP